MHVDCVIKAMG